MLDRNQPPYMMLFARVRFKPFYATFAIALLFILIFIFTWRSNEKGDSEFVGGNSRAKIASRWKHDAQSGLDKYDELSLRIEDLKRIKLSITDELMTIEREKSKLMREKSSLVNKNNKLLTQISTSKALIRQLELDISAGRKQKSELVCDNIYNPLIVFRPSKLSEIEQYSLPTASYDGVLGEKIVNIRRKSIRKAPNFAFDLSGCPLSEEFKFHLFQDGSNHQIESYDSNADLETARKVLSSHRQHTTNISEACLVVSLMAPGTKLSSFPFDKNLLVVNFLAFTAITTSIRESLGNAAIASSNFKANSYQDKFDILIPGVLRAPSEYDSIIGSIPPQSPIERKYLASYFGRGSNVDPPAESSKSDALIPEIASLSPLERILQVVHQNSIDDLFLFIYDCSRETDPHCNDEREKMIELSTFLIILPDEYSSLSDQTSTSIYLAFMRGSIPVIVGKESIRLPFDEVIDWRKATILLPVARLPEIHFILRSIGPEDLYQLKYHGRRIFERHLATVKQIFETMIAVMSIERFNYPPPPTQKFPTKLYFPSKELLLDVNCTTPECQETKNDGLTGLLSSEILGPHENPVASRAYRRNMSLALTQNYALWNNHLYSPLFLFPSNPIDPVAPSEFKFLSQNKGYRPINSGLGGAGAEFSQALGGDNPNEQFTIVILTYERQDILMRTLTRLKGLAYLNKILVVWNGVNHKPGSNLVWPDVGVPIEVVKVNQNSLNNRFLPYDTIETDAILSLDDDSPLRQDEIVFAFRVWRQSRDRIVGFPGRYHAWDSDKNSWAYNSNHSCELSMVLTGGAFYHIYYSYIYTYEMPAAIRSVVDKFMNCEDIAMNFLVAHLTRKPPMKVTSRWTFHCPSCPSSLSEDDSHFRERHECLNIFTSIYGYMPLLSTQHRSDSVLFKTRLPRDKQKCFKFV